MPAKDLEKRREQRRRYVAERRQRDPTWRKKLNEVERLRWKAIMADPVRRAKVQKRCSDPAVRARKSQRACDRIQDRRSVVWAAKSRPCTDCGETYPPYVMDLDHVRGVKVTNVGRMVSSGNYSLADIVVEIAKCDVVCSNCHRIRTYKDHAGQRPLSRRVPNHARSQVSEPTLFDALEAG